MTFCILAEDCFVFDRLTSTSGSAYRNSLCEGCRNRAERELNLLRYDYVDLSQIVAKKDGHSETKISRPKPESSPPLDLEVLTLRSQIADVVHEAELAVRLHLRMNHAYLPAREGYLLASGIAYLSPRVNDLARVPGLPNPCGVDEVLNGRQILVLIGALHRRAQRMCGITPRTLTVPGSCPRCRGPSLRRHDGDPEQIWCATCNMRLSKPDYYAALRMQFAPPRHPGAGTVVE